jgi:uncharacterized protein (TIGR00661 family)
MTQALALGAFLRGAGHEVVRVLVGRSPHRSIPDYFGSGMHAPVAEFDAPAQVPGEDRQALSVGRTVVDAVRRSPRFLRATVQIAEATAEADVVVNLLDLMGGLSRRMFPVEAPSLAIAHNYLFLHPELSNAPGPEGMRRLVMAYTRATAAGSERKLALSFTELPDRPEIGLEVVPPLLRPGLEALDVHDGDYLLAYALNPGYGSELAGWQRRSGAEVHCYVEGGAEALDGDHGHGFHVHDLDAEGFLARLAGCRAFAGSAGFESLCEAHWLGKPVLAVPTDGQFEQTLNAWDAERAGVARTGTYADLDELWDDPPTPSTTAVHAFRRWVARAPEVFVDAVERTARAARPATREHRAEAR